MKNKIFTLLFLSAGMLFAINSNAQVSINLSIGQQPSWAPGGHNSTPYYYIPDMNVYYDVPAHQFVYLDNNRWKRAANLPGSYRLFDLYQVHKLPLNQQPAYLNHDYDRKQYAQYRGNDYQQLIGDSYKQMNYTKRNEWTDNRSYNNGRNNIREDRGYDRHYGAGR